MPDPANPKPEIRKLASSEPVDCELWQQIGREAAQKAWLLLSACFYRSGL